MKKHLTIVLFITTLVSINTFAIENTIQHPTCIIDIGTKLNVVDQYERNALQFLRAALTSKGYQVIQKALCFSQQPQSKRNICAILPGNQTLGLVDNTDYGFSFTDRLILRGWKGDITDLPTVIRVKLAMIDDQGTIIAEAKARHHDTNPSFKLTSKRTSDARYQMAAEKLPNCVQIQN